MLNPEYGETPDQLSRLLLNLVTSDARLDVKELAGNISL